MRQAATTVRTPPRARPAAVPVALLAAAALVAVGVVAVRDLAVSQGWSAGSPWIPDLVQPLDGLQASTGLSIGGGIAALVGFLLVRSALKPGRPTHLRASGETDLWLEPRALGALAQSVADRVAGVVSAEATRSGRRRVVIEVVTTEDEEAVTARVRSAVDQHVGHLTATTIVVRAKEIDA